MRYLLSLLFAVSTLFAQARTPLQELLDLFGITAEETTEQWLQQGRERWEFDKRYEIMRPQAFPIFERMGMVSEAAPLRSNYKYALVHGALQKTVILRIAYLKKLIDRGIVFEKFVFLTGERPLQPQELLVGSGQTEADIVRWAYERSTLPKDVPVEFISVPLRFENGVVCRPRTCDTIEAWLNTNPAPGFCLAISNQPYVQYQRAVLNRALPIGFGAETAGEPITGSPSVALMLDTVAKMLLYSE